MNAFIDVHRDRLGIEPICRVLQVAPSAYRRQATRQRNPALRSQRAIRDEQLSGDIDRHLAAQPPSIRRAKVWRQLKREGQRVARCTVERLMQQLGGAE